MLSSVSKLYLATPSFAMQDDGGSQTTIVAVDKDKNSQQAVKWAVENVVPKEGTLILIHIRVVQNSTHGYYITDVSSDINPDDNEQELGQVFVPYRKFCARKGMQMTEVLLQSTDVAKALIEYIGMNRVKTIVVGASNRNLLRKLRGLDVPSSLTKSAPEYCSVYVIYKNRILTARAAKGHTNSSSLHNGHLNSLPPKKSPSGSPRCRPDSYEDSSVRYRGGGSWRDGSLTPPSATMKYDRMQSPHMLSPTRDMRPLSTARTIPLHSMFDYVNNSGSSVHRSSSRETSSSEDMDLPNFSTDYESSMDFKSLDTSMSSDISAATSRDVEAEMRRLRQELKLTMDMYTKACQEATLAKKKAEELNQMRDAELRKVEELKQAEESALEMVKTEKAKCKAAIEAAEAAQKIAAVESQKRFKAELKAKTESEERRRAIHALNSVHTRYRKYNIEEIRYATRQFSPSLKIGEGGYGPVYRAMLDHTPVAIKVLRPEAQHGRRQFQQEVEVLSCIRHPNMVLLLGACPEYGCLVYEFMDYGSLEDRLARRGDTPPIPWEIRFKIAAEIATGLLFLHQTKPEPLVHRDLKPGNILLDRNFVCKIADVGLARLVPPSVIDSVSEYRMTSAAGTFCYIDPEYQQTGLLGTKSDIYSLGVMLLQIITAKPPMGLSHHVQRSIEQGTFKEMLDPAVPDWPIEEALSYARLALRCMEFKRKDRPDLATEILPELARLKAFAQKNADYNY